MTRQLTEAQKEQTRDRVRVKIMSMYRSSRSIEAAAEKALAREVRKAKADGWSRKTINGMVQLFADVAADMVVEVVRCDAAIRAQVDAVEAEVATATTKGGVDQ